MIPQNINRGKSLNDRFSAARGSVDVIEHILSQDGCDVDPINRIAKATPLHLALELPDRDLRKLIVESLLDAGADIKCVCFSFSKLTADYLNSA